ncbi:glycosyltransferase family 4 protein [Parabacteroides johnsonii]|nr:glycosyltransferase family 4 protein [Parabacteroides johnsonii]UEA89340.1 glycosyltransferase family 4 protein [Parabacteroides johnsonii]UWP41503.1 glycosyltransferase family 4 protein [Parabacteroides johnsonii DSM 18315]
MRIALITASERPIPATKGGATQTMMTHLIDVNEEYGEHHFFIFSYYDYLAYSKSKEYKHTSFYYYKPNAKMDKLQNLFWRMMRKLSAEQIYLRSNFIKWCVNTISKEHYDIVILEGQCFHTQYMRQLYKGPLILHMHIDRLNNELKSTKDIINCCDGLFAISEFCKRRMTNVVPCASEKIIVVRNTVDTDRFSRRGRKNAALAIRNKAGVKPNQKLISYCGRIVPDKGVLELVKAMVLLNDSNLKLMIIGSSVYAGSKKNDYILKVEKEAKKICGGALFTGYIEQSKLPNYLSGSDITVIPSLCREAAGNVTLEALGCEVPVIASSQGGIPEYADTMACRLVNCDEHFIENLAKEIHELAYNEKLYSSLKFHAREVAVAYNKYNYYRNFIHAVNSILNQ